MSTMPTIRPDCPYCETAEYLKYIYLGQNYRRAVRCGNCGFSGPAPRVDDYETHDAEDQRARNAWLDAVADIEAGQWAQSSEVVAASEVDTVLDDYRKPHERDVYRESPLKGIRQVLSRLEDERDELIRSRNQAGEYISDIGEALGLPRGDRIPSKIQDEILKYRTAADQIQTIRDAVHPLFGRWSIQKEDPTPDQVRKLIRAADRLQDEVDQFTEAEKQRLGSSDREPGVPKDFTDAWRQIAKAVGAESPTGFDRLPNLGEILHAIDELKKRYPILKRKLAEALEYETPSDDDEPGWGELIEAAEATKMGNEWKPAFRKVSQALMNYSQPPKRADKVAGDMVDKIYRLKKRANGRKRDLMEAMNSDHVRFPSDEDPTWQQVVDGVEWAVDHICQAPNDHDVLGDIRMKCPELDQPSLPGFIERWRAVAFFAADTFDVVIDDPADWNSVRDQIEEAGAALETVQKLVPHRQFEDHAAGELDIDEVWEAIRSNTYLYSHAEHLGQRWETVCDIFDASPDSPEDALHRMRQRESIARNANQFLTELAELVRNYREDIDPNNA